MARSPPPQFLRHLLKRSLVRRLLTPLHPLFQRADLILTRFDELLRVQRAILEGFGGGLGAECAGVALAGAVVGFGFLAGAS